MPDNAGTLILHHNHTPANHHHHDHNNTAGSSSRSRLPADSPHQPYIFSASQQGQDSNLAPHLNHSHSHSGHGFDQLSHEYDGDEALDGDEDRQSDEGSEGEPGFNEIEFWLQRCSICFDARLDFCLEYCRDQFCRDCFQRYVKEVVSNSWGLNVTKIKCPVCQDVISLSEWTQYVDQSTLAQYQQYNQPYRSFSRFCNDCEHELVISEVDRAVIGLPVRDLVPIFDRMSVDLKALLILGGMNPDDPISVSSSSSSSSNLPHTKPKRRSSHSIRDTLAREIVQKFADDYQSYCGVSQGAQVSLPSKAQSHFSNLALRTFGSPFTQPLPLPITGQRLSTSSQAQQQPVASPIPSSTQQPQNPPPRTSSHSAQDLISNHPLSAIFQRRQHTSRSIGVLEMYKSLMMSLLDLFDLNRKDQEDTTGNIIRIDKRTGETENSETSPVILSHGAVVQDLAPGGEGEGTGRVDTTEQPVVEAEAEDESTSADAINLKRKGPLDSMSRRPKRTRPGRSGVTTRAEGKRQVEIKKALVRLSKRLSSIETRPEQWKELQFLHVRWLRWDWCNHCNQELCLQCGVSSHHESQDCSDYMRSLIAGNDEASSSQRRCSAKTGEFLPSKKNDFPSMTSLKGKGRSELDANTIQWKLANTNPCPNCCILIHRDDGCNKVDCMLCGYRFCWICREAWGAACGFFKCGRQAAVVDSPNADGMYASMDVSRGEDQIPPLDVSHHLTGDADQGQAGTGASPQDQRRNRAENVAGVISEMPEIGVPNVFVIHTKRSRA
ncbi:E3 ubiquitin-protein ligase arih2 [Dissophora ornata]|nr:E3 ubiquitin-protein ligase arih2 [Dissophora ornata]